MAKSSSVPAAAGSTPRATQHAHSRRQAAASRPTPSSSLLAIFATVAASSSTVDGHPLATQTPPPDFLCPQLSANHVAPTPAPVVNHRDVSSAAQGSSSLASDASQDQSGSYPRSVSVADKYVSCTDGRWRKTDVWTLYGSTYCMGDACSSIATATSTQVIIESGTVITTVAPSTSTATASGIMDDIDVLPSGWQKANTIRDDPLTPIIISLSVVLAIGICIFIISCSIWRRRRARRLKDLEKRARGMGGLGQIDEETRDEFKRHHRLWAKATARWKASARQSARRRKKRTSASSRDADSRLLAETTSRSTTSLHRTQTVSSSSRSMTASRRPSTADFHAPNSSFPSEPDSARSPRRPPSYLSDSSDASSQPRGDFHAVSAPEAESSLGAGIRTVVPPDEQRLCFDDKPLPYEDAGVAGHVATDDKTFLASMAALASAPPPADESEQESGMSRPYASVPPLDDGFEAVPFEVQVVDCDAVVPEASGSRLSPSPRPSSYSRTPTYSRDPSPHPSILPPPPPKSRLAAPTFYEYPPSFEEDVLGAEPEPCPSAPPFDDEENPFASAPPLEYDDLADSCLPPSAPPLEDEEDEADSPRQGHQDLSRRRLSVEPTLALSRAASHLPAATWHASPPRYLP